MAGRVDAESGYSTGTTADKSESPAITIIRNNMANLSRPSSASPRPSSVGSVQSNLSSSSQSYKGNNRLRQDICVSEEVKVAVDIALERFRMNDEQKEMEFPSSLTSTERAYIHRYCQNMGLKSKSRGKGANRYLTVSKKDGSHVAQIAATLNLVRNSRHQIQNLLQRFPVTNKERQELQPRTERGQLSDGMSKDLTKTTTGRLNNGVPQVPPKRVDSELSAFRETLPVFQHREEIVKMINDNRVILISGETGSGKTTQVPQMILDDCHANNRACRIFCTQPRRLSALSMAERVASERGEKIGQTVGYQIRLESRVSPKTLLTFCTNGVLLRTLMGGDVSVATVTHIIVDEIHERDRFSDFLLICLRDLLPRYKNLRVVLMSAVLNLQLFSTYFNNCPIMSVPGKLFEVKEYFLEDILKWTAYSNKEMDKCRSALAKAPEQKQQLSKWYVAENLSDSKTKQESGEIDEDLCDDQTDGRVMEIGDEKEDLEAWLVTEMDSLLSQAWLKGDEDIFTQIFHLILSENVSVDYMHTETSATPLMIAAGRGFFGIVEQLLNLGASTSLRASNDWSVLDWARKFERGDVIELLSAHIAATETVKHDDTMLVKSSHLLSAEERDLLNLYHQSFDDEKVDLDLIMVLLRKLHASKDDGGILVFLPGYDSIVALRDALYEDKAFNDIKRFVLYTLHSNMQSSDQKRVFKTPPPGVRKVILSTNLAETSLTIDDVVFVVDSGKVKEKSFDALTSVTMLKCNWISRASALQRKGRAGRCQPGLCYHMFSRIRYESMQEYQDPELLRYPLQELCLHTKLLAPVSCPIADFLSKAPEPPAFLVTRNAVHLLKQIDALDTFEDLTELGHHLADLPVEPRYGKMILYSVVLKCLDPILTISCALAYRDPFVLPAIASQKRAANMSRRRFAADTHSDHMALLRAFQAWQKARSDGWDRPFCERNFLSSATMEMIVGMRTQLLGQLRASGFVRARGGGDIRDLNTNSENWAVVKAALCAGMYPNIIRVDRHLCKLTTQKENKVHFHNSSVLSPAPNTKQRAGTNPHQNAVKNLPTDWLVYEEMTRAHTLAQVRCCTVVSPITAVLFGGPAKLSQDNVKEVETGGYGDGPDNSSFLENSSDSEASEKEDARKVNLRLDDWIAFKVDPDTASVALQLRQKWASLFIRRMRAPSKPWSQVDESVIRTVIGVLTNQEQALGLQQPAGIGQRPRPMSTESIMCNSDNRRGSYDTEQSDDSSSSNHDGRYGNRTRAFKNNQVSPRKKDSQVFSRSSEDKSETSSVRSSSSAAGSATNSGTNSLRGSAASSPCGSPSPQPSSPAKWGMGGSDPGASSSHPCRFFIMKCNNYKNLEISMQRGIWATTPSNEKKLNKAFKDGKMVYLVFSVQGSGHFQGYARMSSAIGTERAKEFSAPGLGATFKVEWMKRANLPFQHAHHLLNPWNDNKKVQISRDGQDLEPIVGEALTKLWDKLPTPMQKTSPSQNIPKFMNKPQMGTNSPENRGQGFSQQRFGNKGQNDMSGPWGSGANRHGGSYRGQGSQVMPRGQWSPGHFQSGAYPQGGNQGYSSQAGGQRPFSNTGMQGYNSHGGSNQGVTPSGAPGAGRMSPHMNQPVNSIYGNNSSMSQNAMLSPGSTGGGMMFSNTQSNPPSMMILQRGSSAGQMHHGGSGSRHNTAATTNQNIPSQGQHPGSYPSNMMYQK